MKEKREIKGVKETNENYTGNVSGIVKKIIAIALSLGMLLTAAQAIRMYNEWKASRSNDTKIENVQKSISFEDVQKIVEEYREAKKNNDTEKIDALNREAIEGNYTNVLFKGLKEEIIRSLGLDIEKVEVYEARDGVFLIDKEKIKKYAVVDHTGQINSRVKYVDKNGKNPKIPYEMRQMVSNLGKECGWGNHLRIADLEEYYADFEYVAEYEPAAEIEER